MEWRYVHKDIVPFAAMVTIECTNVGVNILFKTATARGLSYFVFIAYSYAVSTLVFLLPLLFISCSSTGFPAIKLSILCRIFCLAVIGFAALVSGYKGLEYNSPTLASALSNLIPAFTFVLAIFFRMEKADLRCSSTKAKIIGSIVSISVLSADVGVNILFKAATEQGLSFYVFIVYSYAVSALFLLLPLPFIFHRSTGLPPFTVSLLCRIFLLALIGFLAQFCGYRGIEYSSPTLASAVANLQPAYIFILAVIFRMEKAVLTSPSTQAKILGSIVSISVHCTEVGVNILYKAATEQGLNFYVFIAYSYPVCVLFLLLPVPLIFHRSTGLPPFTFSLFCRIFLLASIGFIAQLCGYKGIKYSSPTLASAIANLLPAYIFILAVIFRMEKAVLTSPSTQAKILGSMVSISVSYLLEANSHSWRLESNLAIVAIVYAGFFSTGASTFVNTWGIQIRGPVYVSSFKPLSVVIAAAMSFIFLGDILHLGCVIGALILSCGFYAVLWGKSKEEELTKDENCGLGSRSDSKTPLLQATA
ncbi:hypothetical protein L6164_006927 [Bauhinia variegata]|uniref:Uncharacterized protein n=1 Tax=Bauhinia variegata TaxID=167791 RepID=A0ACB9PVX5_BAUVA|nr:hypothetical protein L6164_006927 [Bauhinia variegata]